MSKAYPFGPKQVHTHKQLVLRDGLAVTRTMPMANVSNAPLTEEEHLRYLRHCQRAGTMPASKEDVAAARVKIQAAIEWVGGLAGGTGETWEGNGGVGG